MLLHRWFDDKTCIRGMPRDYFGILSVCASIVIVNRPRNIFGSYLEFVVMISVVEVDNGSVQGLLLVLVAQDHDAVSSLV